MGKDEAVSIFVKSIPFRKEFHLAFKESKESPIKWLSRVKELADLCDFGNSYNLFVLDKFLTGLETEIIDHLCSSAEFLDINSSLEIIHAYDTTQVDDIKVESTGYEPATVFVGEPETIFPEVNVKPDYVPKDGQQAEHDCFNDFDDSTDDDLDDNSKDSDFHCSDYEDTLPKKRTRAKKDVNPQKQKTTPKVKKEKPKKETIEPDATEDDPNAPPKKRKYKKRAVKEKQIFECEICHYKVNHECHLRRHKLIHLNEKSFICHMCGKGFNLFINLNAHLRRHAGFKPHVCEVCKASFMDRTRLRLHQRTHTGERPFGCDACGKRFADRYYLKVHKRLHTGEKPFKCDKCLKTFSQSSSLSLHKKKNCLISKIP